MAAKRFTQSSIEWAKLAERVPESQRGKFLAFKGKSDSYLRRMLAYPENPPKIDWAAYKSKAPVPSIVDSFQKSYESMQIPYPKDTVSSIVDAQEQQLKKGIAEFKSQSAARIANYRKEIEYLNSLIPFDQMTLEDYAEYYPEDALSTDKPSFWPHTPDEQLGYSEGQAQQSGSH